MSVSTAFDGRVSQAHIIELAVPWLLIALMM